MNCRKIHCLTPTAILILISLVPWAVAQEPPTQPSPKSVSQAQPGNTYRLDFTLSEIENDKKINARSYSLIAQGAGVKNSLHVGKKVPVETGSLSDAKLTQFTYLDIGMAIDCRVEEVPRGVLLDLAVDFSSIAAEQASNPALAVDPVIGRVTAETKAIVDIGRPTIVSRMDDPASKRTFEIDVTVTRVN